jgi:hypothetical protein
MTGHDSDQMIQQSYAHIKEEEIKARAKETREKGDPGPAVLFQGRVLNLTTETEYRILSNPRAFRVGKIGLCSDITGCKSDMFECLECKFFVPDADMEEYFQEQNLVWLEKARKCILTGNKSLSEQAEYKASLFLLQVDNIKIAKLLAEGGENDY